MKVLIQIINEYDECVFNKEVDFKIFKDFILELQFMYPDIYIDGSTDSEKVVLHAPKTTDPAADEDTVEMIFENVKKGVMNHA